MLGFLSAVVLPGCFLGAVADAKQDCHHFTAEESTFIREQFLENAPRHGWLLGIKEVGWPNLLSTLIVD